MNKKFKSTILCLTQGNSDHASSRIRGILYFPFLIENGYRVIWIPRIPRMEHTFISHFLLFPFLKRINTLRIFSYLLFGPYDILFIQRLFLPSWSLQFVQLRNKKIIFDFDDAIYHSEIDNDAKAKTISMVKNSHLVITGSPVLKDWASTQNDACVTITSPIDTEKIGPSEKVSDNITIGWIGSKWTSKYLAPIEEVFKQLFTNLNVELLLVGSGKDVLPGISKSVEMWQEKTEFELIARMDIGIMPLGTGEFEQGKGGYKLIQYMAAGLPVVASPVGINTEIVDHGINGFLCSTSEEWFNCLERLCKDKGLRMEMGRMGRQKVLSQYSLKVCSEKLINLLDTL